MLQSSPQEHRNRWKKNFFQLQKHVIAACSEQDVEEWQYGLTRPC